MGCELSHVGADDISYAVGKHATVDKFHRLHRNKRILYDRNQGYFAGIL
jgi:hypothetical protein